MQVLPQTSSSCHIFAVIDDQGASFFDDRDAFFFTLS
jgi:hypothetical protein